jgi:hypothetical protein
VVRVRLRVRQAPPGCVAGGFGPGQPSMLGVQLHCAGRLGRKLNRSAAQHAKRDSQSSRAGGKGLRSLHHQVALEREPNVGEAP